MNRCLILGWRTKFNREFQHEMGMAPVASYIIDYKIQCIRYNVMIQSEDETVKIVMELELKGNRPWKLWLHVVDVGLKNVEV